MTRDPQAQVDVRDVLLTIVRMSRLEQRGPTTPRVAEDLQIKERSMRARIARYRKLGYVQHDPEGGVLVTTKGLELIQPPPKKAKR